MIHSCWACLRTANDVRPMNYEEINMYTTFVLGIQLNTSIMKICVYCRWLLRKFIKLTQQWKYAYGMLHDGLQMNKELIFHQHKYTITTEHHYLGPDDIQEEHSDGHDADELPLIMLTKGNCRKKKRRKDKIEVVETEIKVELDIKEECTEDLNVGLKDQKRNTTTNEPKDGFSSRMVRETNEYVVIKLTRDQVLEEMQQKSSSDPYLRAAYKCDKCVKGFNFEDVLNTHKTKHSPENGSFQCNICTQYCPSAVSLRGHIKSHTTRYKCKICGSVRLSRQHLLEHHAIAHTSEAASYRCDSCPFVTNKRTVLQRHVKTHSAERLACHACGKTFKTIMSLRVHTVRHDKSRGFQCMECDKSFIFPSVLHKHVQSVHERHDYYCVECDVRFKSPETLKHHFKKAKRHRDPSSYKYCCEQCPAQFISSSMLQAHGHSAHGVGSAHACHLCPRSYSSRDTLRAHVWRAHANVPRTHNACALCGNTFSRASSLKSHMRTHTRARAHRTEKHTQKEELPVEARTTENASLEI